MGQAGQAQLGVFKLDLRLKLKWFSADKFCKITNAKLQLRGTSKESLGEMELPNNKKDWEGWFRACRTS